jgi:hypothetical protein
MNNRELRLLTDIIKQVHSVKKEKISDILLLDLGIDIPQERINKIPSLKQTLFKEVITTTQGRPKISKVIIFKN